jgi:hypothetical protein
MRVISGRPRCSRQLGRLLAVALAVAVYASAGRATEISRLDAQCRSHLHRYVFDCACTTEFLESNMAPEQGEILLKLWVLGLNDNNQKNELLNLYLQFGRKTVDDAVMAFHRHRDRLPAFCMQGGPIIAD